MLNIFSSVGGKAEWSSVSFAKISDFLGVEFWDF